MGRGVGGEDASRVKTRWNLLVGIGLGALGAAIWTLANRPAAPSAGDPAVQGTKLFQDVFATVRAFAVDSLEAQELYRRAAVGVIEELDDPYARLLGPGQRGLSSDAPGPLGMYLDRIDGTPVVVSTVPGSPAEQAGVESGDLLVAVDSVPADAARIERALGALEGAPGSMVSLRLRRPGTRGLTTIEVTRGAAPMVPATAAVLLGGTVAHVRVARFVPGIADSVGREVEAVVRSGATSLVLDLRGAVGGSLDQGTAIADLFLGPSDTLGISRGRPGSPSLTYADSTPSRFSALPIAVLVNQGTAGAAEAVAGALQDHDRAAILGTTTFGRGVTQSDFTLGDGATLRLTTALWVTPSGRQIQRPPRPASDSTPRPEIRSDAGRKLLGGGGIVPDRVVLDTGTGDLVLDAARKLLQSSSSMRAVLGLRGDQ